MTRLSAVSNRSTPLTPTAAHAAAHDDALSCLSGVEMSGHARYAAQASLLRGEAIASMFVSVRDSLRRLLRAGRSATDAGQGTAMGQASAKSTDRVRSAPARTRQLIDDSGVTGFGM